MAIEESRREQTATAKGRASRARASGNGPSESGDDGFVASKADALEGLLRALLAVRDGDFSVRLPARRVGVMGEISSAFNQLVDMNARMSRELVRVGRVIGHEGRMTERASLREGGGDWGVSVEAVNSLI